MTPKTVRLVVNLDLAEPTYAFLRARIRSSIPNQNAYTVTLEDISAGLLMGESMPVEIIAFLKRQPDPRPDRIEPALRAIQDMCVTIEAVQLKSQIRRVTLVDCGDTLMSPLSDLAVLGQYLEALSDNLSADAEGLILAADCDFEAESCPTVTVRDTRSEAFIEHVADFTRRALKVLNTQFGQGDVPKLEGIAPKDIEAVLSALTASR